MSAVCPHCRSTSTVGKGTGEVTLHRLADGMPEPYRAEVRRIVCRSCGRNGTLYDPHDLVADRAVRDHVVERVFALGQTAAAAETGIPRTTIQRHLDAWSSVREGDVRDAEPEFIHLEPARIRGTDCILAIDVDRSTLVDIVQAEGLPAWMAAPGRREVVSVSTTADPRMIGIVAEALPGARTMIAPATAARAVRLEGDLALRGLRRRAAGSNGMPTPAEFSRSLAPGAGPAEWWPVAAVALRSAVGAVLDLLQLRSRKAGERAWAETELAAGGAERILRWLRVWREPVLEGLDHAFVDRIAKLAAGTRRAIARRRPVLGFSDMRALVLLRDFVRSIVPRPPGMPPRTVAEGRPLAGLEAMLAA